MPPHSIPQSRASQRPRGRPQGTWHFWQPFYVYHDSTHAIQCMLGIRYILSCHCERQIKGFVQTTITSVPFNQAHALSPPSVCGTLRAPRHRQTASGANHHAKRPPQNPFFTLCLCTPQRTELGKTQLPPGLYVCANLCLT